MQLDDCFTGASFVGNLTILTCSCTCSRAIQAARQVTYSLKDAGERRRRARLPQGVPPALAGRQLDILEAVAECLRQAGLSRLWQPLCETVVSVKQLTVCSGHYLKEEEEERQRAAYFHVTVAVAHVTTPSFGWTHS